jgi:hypothetical protein
LATAHRVQREGANAREKASRVSPNVSKSMGSIVDIAHLEPKLESKARVAVPSAVVQSPRPHVRVKLSRGLSLAPAFVRRPYANGEPLNLTSAAMLLCCSIFASGVRSNATQSGPAQENAAEVIVIGCLVRLDNSAWRPGTASGAGRGASRNPALSGFALKDAVIVQGPPRATGATGLVATRSEREFRLVKTDLELELEKFVGQQVEVKARPVGSDSLDAGAATSTTTSRDTQTADRGHESGTRAVNQTANLLRVISARALSRTCPPPGGR